MAKDVTKLVNNENPRVSQLNVNSKTYEIWDGTARDAIKELQDVLYGLNTASESDLGGMIEKVNAIYNELTKIGENNEGLASSVLDALFNKFDGDKAKQALVADKVGTGTVGGTTRPVYIKAGVPTQVTYSTASGGPTANATLTSGSTFVIPQVSQAAGGQVTVTERTMTMPTLLAIGTTEGTAADATHTHAASLATDTTTNPDVTLASASTYKLTAGGNSVTFKMPTAPTWSTLSGAPKLAAVATSGSYNDLSNKPDLLAIGDTATTAAAGNHTHTATLATDTTTNPNVTLASATTYKLTAGGNSVTFKMPSLLTTGTTADTAAAGNHTHATSITTSTGTSAITLASGKKYQLNAGGTSVIFTMPTAPTVNNAALTINGQSGSVAFTANASTAVTKTVSLYEKSAPSSDNNFTLELGIKFE